MIHPPDAPLVSVLMANRDGAAWIGEAVRSVLGQNLDVIELVLVDDASGDDSVARARAAAGGDPRLKLVRLERSLGPGGARNRAMAEASGEWAAVVDSDDLVAPDRFIRLLALARARRADLVADNLIPFSPSGDQPPMLRGPAWNRPREVSLAEFITCNRPFAPGACLGYLKPLIHGSALQRLGAGYDAALRVGEDYDLVARLLASGARYWIDPAPRYRYRRHAASTSHRLRRGDVEALLAADDRFRARGGFTREVLAALDRRRQSLERALAYDAIVAALKARAPVRALGQALASPGALPLLMFPIAARMARLRGGARAF
jgi:succinoglycan biosynthesis protein ExoO